MQRVVGINSGLEYFKWSYMNIVWYIRKHTQQICFLVKLHSTSSPDLVQSILLQDLSRIHIPYCCDFSCYSSWFCKLGLDLTLRIHIIGTTHICLWDFNANYADYLVRKFLHKNEKVVGQFHHKKHFWQKINVIKLHFITKRSNRKFNIC